MYIYCIHCLLYIYTIRKNIKLKLVLWYKPQFGNIFPVYIISTPLSWLKKKKILYEKYLYTIYIPTNPEIPRMQRLVRREEQATHWKIISCAKIARANSNCSKITRDGATSDVKSSDWRTFEDELDVSRWLPIWLARPSKRCFKSSGFPLEYDAHGWDIRISGNRETVDSSAW